MITLDNKGSKGHAKNNGTSSFGLLFILDGYNNKMQVVLILVCLCPGVLFTLYQANRTASCLQMELSLSLAYRALEFLFTY